MYPQALHDSNTSLSPFLFFSSPAADQLRISVYSEHSSGREIESEKYARSQIELTRIPAHATQWEV
jgi:hypothetical protein